MIEPDFESMAEKIVNVCMGIKHGETVFIDGRSDALDFCERIGVATQKVGGHPLISVDSDDYVYRVMTEVEIDYLKETPNHRFELMKATDVVIAVGVERQDPGRFQEIPEYVRTARRMAGKPIIDFLNRENRVRWLGTGYPTAEQAQTYGIDFEFFHDMYWSAMDVNYDELRGRAQRLAYLLGERRSVHITSPKGTDIILDIEGRKVMKDDGIIDAEDVANGVLALNLPSGEVCLAPHEDGAQGMVVFDVAYHEGKRIEDLEVTFHGGKIEPRRAKKGYQTFLDVLKNSHGDCDRIGELGIGLNPKVEKAVGYILTDEKILGTVHLAIGRNQAMGGTNDSDLHWDLLIEKPTVVVDGRTIMENGKMTD